MRRGETRQSQYSVIISRGDPEKAGVEYQRSPLAVREDNPPNPAIPVLSSQVERFYRRYPKWDKQREKYRSSR